VSSNITDIVIDSIREVILQNDLEESSLTPDTAILNDTSLDSLALAELLIILEGKTRKDPFADGFINFRTVGELAKLYEQ
jgi:acyl carrier protein